MSSKHKAVIDSARGVSIAIAGAGGTGCALAASLGRMSKTLRSLYPDYRMRIAIYDPAEVRDANIGRQPFGALDIGLGKAQALANAMGMAFPVECEGHPIPYECAYEQQIVAICVDSAMERRQVREAMLDRRFGNAAYIIDCGNMRDFGQCIVGLSPSRAKLLDGEAAMPPPWDLASDLYDPSKDNPSEPSCSTAEAIASQDFNVNHFSAMVASEHIWKLITRGELETRGAFFNLRTMSCSPLKMDVCRQVGDPIDGRGQSGEKYRLTVLECGSLRYLKYESPRQDGNFSKIYRIENGELIDSMSMRNLERQENALWRNIDTAVNQNERLAA